MAIDPSIDVAAEKVSPIENEIPAYRAISPLAVVSLVLGLIAALSFAELWFLLAAGLAVAAGFYADWTIRRMPDVLTGRGLAQAGVALGLIFGLSALTTNLVSGLVLKNKATEFATQYVKVLESGSLARIIHSRIPPSRRASMTPDQALKEYRESAGDPMMYETQIAPSQKLLDRLKEPGVHLEFVGLEAARYDGLKPKAAAVYEVHGPAKPGEPAEQYLLVQFDGEETGRDYQWYVSELVFPYQRNTFVMPAKKPDDGHGHSH